MTQCRNQISSFSETGVAGAGTSVQSTTGSRAVHISGSNAGYTMVRGSVKSTGYPLHSLPLPCVTVCHHISTGLYHCGILVTDLPDGALQHEPFVCPLLWLCEGASDGYRVTQTSHGLGLAKRLHGSLYSAGTVCCSHWQWVSPQTNSGTIH